MEKYLTLWRRGILVPFEVADRWILFAVSEEYLNFNWIESHDQLPIEIQDEIRSKLVRLQGDDFLWLPFLVSTSTEPRDPTLYQSGLRQLFDGLYSER